MAYVELTGIDGVPLVGVNDNTEEARVGVDELGLEADLQVVEHRGIIQVSQVGHVLALLKLGRIDLTKFLRLENFFLKNIHVVIRNFDMELIIHFHSVINFVVNASWKDICALNYSLYAKASLI